MAAQPRTASAPRLYMDHDPSFEWVNEEASDTLLLHLPEYKKEYLKVQVDSHGNLRTSGERPLDGNRWSRFWKDFRLPKNCNANGIRAKFEKETLFVHLPKLIAPAPDDRRPPAAEPKPGLGDHVKSQNAKGKGAEMGTDEKRDARQQQKADDENKTMEPSAKQKVSGDSNGGHEYFQEEAARYDMSAIAMELRRQRKRLMLNMAVAVTVLVGLGVYIYSRN